MHLVIVLTLYFDVELKEMDFNITEIHHLTKSQYGNGQYSILPNLEYKRDSHKIHLSYDIWDVSYIINRL